MGYVRSKFVTLDTLWEWISEFQDNEEHIMMQLNERSPGDLSLVKLESKGFYRALNSLMDKLKEIEDDDSFKTLDEFVDDVLRDHENYTINNPDDYHSPHQQKDNSE
jgi:hypothetical protein